MFRIALDAATFDDKPFPSALIAVRETWNEVEAATALDIAAAKTIAKAQGRKGSHWMVINPEPPHEYNDGIDLARMAIWID